MEKSKFLAFVVVALLLCFGIADAAQLPASDVPRVTTLAKDITLGSTIVQSGFDQLLDNKDLSALRQGQVNFQGNPYNFKEIIAFHNVAAGYDDGVMGLRVITSLTSLDDDYKDGIYLEASKDAMGYYYVFDTPIDISKSTNANPLLIKFYNTQIDIISVIDEKTFDARVWDGKEITMPVSSMVFFNDQRITLLKVAGNSATFRAGNVQKVISGLDTLAGADIELLGTTANTATFAIGSYAKKRITNGDAWIVPCGKSYARQACSAVNPDWVWAVDDLTTNDALGNDLYGSADNSSPGPTLGIRNDYIVNDKSDNPPTMSEAYDFPSNTFGVRFDSLARPSASTTIKYMDLKISLQNADFSAVFSGQSNKPSFLIESSAPSPGLEVLDGNKYIRTNKIWLSVNKANQNLIDILYQNNKKIALARTVNQAAGSNEIGRINHGQTNGNAAVLRLTGQPNADDVRLVLAINADGIANGKDNLEAWLGTLNGEFASLGMSADKVKPKVMLDNVPELVAKGATFSMDVYVSDNKALSTIKTLINGQVVSTLVIPSYWPDRDKLGWAGSPRFNTNLLNGGICFTGWVPGLPGGTYNICDHNITIEATDTDGNSASATARIHVVEYNTATRFGDDVNSPDFNVNADASKLIWKGGQPDDIRLGTKDENHRTKYGIVIANPLENSKSNQVLLKIPNTQIKARIIVFGKYYS
ncbi:MAG: hypothetical protein AABX75_01560 [Nanoarchaeota archaeon]